MWVELRVTKVIIVKFRGQTGQEVKPSTAEPGALIAETPRCIFLPDSV